MVARSRINPTAQVSILPTIHEDKASALHSPRASVDGCAGSCIRRIRSSSQRIRYYLALVVLFVGVFVRPHRYLINDVSTSTVDHELKSRASRVINNITIATMHNPTSFIPPTHKQSYTIQNQTTLSTAPLFYHISPGSTGSRTLYHASCHSGFPSIHHKSFCISQTTGIDGVSEEVVRGVRAHYQVLRLYQLAYDCCSMWDKGKLSSESGREVSSEIHLCQMLLNEWTEQLQTHLKNVVQSGLVGLFDTPYPYFAPQLLQLASEWRTASPIIAMTERDPKGWANSRSKNHGLLICREEYSYESLGASEFDVLGCVSRAFEERSVVQTELSTKTYSALHFWDVFHYRSHNEPVDAEFQRGMERQMELHQQQYLPLANYTPDFFGIHTQSTTHEAIREEDVAIDIRKQISSAQSSWSEKYTTPLTCRGRVNWEIQNDTFVELYHLPKTCGLSKSGKAEKGRTGMIPLMPLKVIEPSKWQE